MHMMIKNQQHNIYASQNKQLLFNFINVFSHLNSGFEIKLEYSSLFRIKIQNNVRKCK